MRIPVIILNYNTFTDCIKCVSFLKRQISIELEIIIVDNCSQEKEVKAIKQFCEEEDCFFIASAENRGYNAGNNIGLRYAVNKGYKYALIVNPDMEFPQKDYMTKMVKAMESHLDIVICGSDILGINNDHQNPWNFSTFWDEFPMMSPLMKLFGSNRSVLPTSGFCDILAGCCLMVRLDFIATLGYFDENVFLFCEEAILGKQVRHHGKRSYYLHEATAVHRHIESSKGSFKKRYRLFWESRWYYLKNYCGYNKFALSMIFLFRKVRYGSKMIYFKLKNIG